MSTPLPSPYVGLELLSTAVFVLDRQLNLVTANPAAESFFAFGLKAAVGQPFSRLFHSAHVGVAAMRAMLEAIFAKEAGVTENDLTVETANGTVLHCACIATVVDQDRVLLEFRPLDQQLKIAREEKIRERQQLNKELLRNLAHEIKNPLGGIRGAAQLLSRELPSAELTEYTDVIVKEADRLQSLMDRLLAPHRVPQLTRINIHEVVERVRLLVAAEFPNGITFIRDFDASLPDFIADREPLIQAILNIVRNAAQAMQGRGQIKLVTRIARQVTLAKKRFRHAIQLQVIDNGPGVPQELRDKIFFPLVSGRDGGTGLGLSVAQSLVSDHQGIIEFDSTSAGTCFTVLLPIRESLTLH